nr:DUF6311 domain-containing protein [Neoroseomonas soli]
MLAGAACFAVILGPGVLDPRNIAWMQERDAATYYLGWSFFRGSPWTWPPAGNPAYGLEIASTIFFVDAVPLVALLLKATIAPATGPWQYHGAWLLTCFVLQAHFAHRLAGLYLADPVARLLVAALACFSPVLLWRLSGPHALTGHYALFGQWVLLWAAWLCLRPPGRRQGAAWLLLGVVAALVNAYLLAMGLALWLADIARRRILGQGAAALALEASAMVAVVAGALWLGGFRPMAGGGLTDFGFGLFRANLLTLLDPQSAWSFVIPGKPRGAGDYEGFGYIGTGGVALLVAALWVVRKEQRPPIPAPYRPFLAAVLALAVFSLSNQIALGSLVLVTIPLPEALERWVAMFRSSGRMIWPLSYLVVFGAAIILCRRLGRGRGRVALAVALLLQAGDGAAGWLPIAREARVAGSAWNSPLRDGFWDEAARRHARIRYLPTANVTPHWQALAHLALRHGIPTDTIYLARVDADALARSRERGMAALRTGVFEAGTLYAIHESLTCMAAAVIDPAQDLLMRLDGVDVLAPGWLTTGTVPAAGQVIHAAGRTGPGLVCAPDASGRMMPGAPGG